MPAPATSRASAPRSRTLNDHVRGIWNLGQTRLSTHPSLYLPFARRRYGLDMSFNDQTEVVIEGFPRSANSFAVNAFVLAQGRPVHVAHHVHAAAQVLAAGRAGVPAILLIREPTDAIVSYLLWQPHLRPRHAVAGYRAMYESLVDRPEMYVVADFDQVTGDYGAVIRRLNRQFGSQFREFDHTDENVQAAFAVIEQKSRDQRGGKLVEEVVARPSEARKALAKDARVEYERTTSARDRDELDALYARLRALSLDDA